jgi:flavin reductase (DIM6/NTAB) family NADH-FMN oxidoreductase RutF
MDKKALQKISYGLYVICSKNEQRNNGQIANAALQVTSDPPTIAVSINKQNCTHEYIQTSKTFTLSILSKKTPMKFIGTFGFQCGRDIDKFKDIAVTTGKNKVPINFIGVFLERIDNVNVLLV